MPAKKLAARAEKPAAKSRSAGKPTAAKREKLALAKNEKKTPKSASKTKTKSKSSGSKKSATARVVKGAAAPAGNALNTMAAGAIVGAVKGAAQSIAKKEARGGKPTSSTAKALSDMAPDAAVGAIAGAAQTMMPGKSGSKTQPAKDAKGGRESE